MGRARAGGVRQRAPGVFRPRRATAACTRRSAAVPKGDAWWRPRERLLCKEGAVDQDGIGTVRAGGTQGKAPGVSRPRRLVAACTGSGGVGGTVRTE